MFKLLLSVLLFCFITNVQATVRIITFHYNLPYLLEMQCKALNKFITDDFHLIVLNDASDLVTKQDIESICYKYKALCVRFKPEWHDFNHPLNSYHKHLTKAYPHLIDDAKSPSWRHSRMIRYALETFAYNHDDVIVILDGDAFPIRSMSPRKWLEDHDIVGSLRAGNTCDYIMPVFVAFDPRKLAVPSEFSLSWDYVNGRMEDTGAYSHRYIQSHPEVKILTVPFLRGDVLASWTDKDYKKYSPDSRSIDLINKLRGYYYEVHMDWHIFHFKGSSHRNIRSERKRLVNEYLTECLEADVTPPRKLFIYPDIKAPWPGDD